MQRPIGIFDSGLGGLTVARAVIDLLPHESVTYIGDTLHTPYGPRDQDEVRSLSIEVMDALVAQGVKMLVIACNTASAATFDIAKRRYQDTLGIPVIEVITPAVRAATIGSTRNRIGVVATAGTIGSGAYQRAFAHAGVPDVTAVAAPRFVEFVEAGETTGDRVLDAARSYLRPLIDANVDTLVLGCTHYPLLAGAIGYVMGPEVRLVSSAQETAADVYRTLADQDLLATGTAEYRFESTSIEQGPFLKLARRFLGPEVGHVEHHVTGVITLPSPEELTAAAKDIAAKNDESGRSA